MIPHVPGLAGRRCLGGARISATPGDRPYRHVTSEPARRTADHHTDVQRASIGGSKSDHFPWAILLPDLSRALPVVQARSASSFSFWSSWALERNARPSVVLRVDRTLGTLGLMPHRTREPVVRLLHRREAEHAVRGAAISLCTAILRSAGTTVCGERGVDNSRGVVRAGCGVHKP